MNKFGAEQAIEKILKELEIKTDGFIRGIELIKTDISSVNDENTKYMKSVKIHLESKQNYEWSSKQNFVDVK